MADQLVAWHDRWKEKGFTVLYVEEGRATSLQTLQESLAETKWPFPVLYDGEGKTAIAYGFSGYPMAYVIDRKGKVAWEGHPASPQARAEIEGAVEKALAAAP